MNRFPEFFRISFMKGNFYQFSVAWMVLGDGVWIISTSALGYTWDLAARQALNNYSLRLKGARQ